MAAIIGYLLPNPSANLVGTEGVIFLRKTAVLLLSFVVFCLACAGNAFAETKLNKTIGDLMGVGYKWGGVTTDGFDCSGFTMYVFGQIGIELPHSSKEQAKKGKEVSKDELRPGDLVFFNTDGKGISHAGIYVGNGEFVHSATNKGVMKNKLSEEYYAKRYITARRVLSDEQYKQQTADVK